MYAGAFLLRQSTLLCSWYLSVFPFSAAMAARSGGSRSPRRRQSSDDSAALVEPPPPPAPTVLVLSSSDDEERPAPQAAGEGVRVAARQAYREGDYPSLPRRPGERPIDHLLGFDWDWWMRRCDQQILAEYGVVISFQELHQGPPWRWRPRPQGVGPTVVPLFGDHLVGLATPSMLAAALRAPTARAEGGTLRGARLAARSSGARQPP